MTKAQPTRVVRDARLRWIPIAKMKASPLGQRELKPWFVDKLVADFDLEELGTPTVSERDGHFYIMDGQHRIEALRHIGWGDQQIQCWTYTGLTEEDEAEKFLKLNDRLNVDAFSKFRIGVNAGRPIESDIERLVRAQGLRISRDTQDGSIGAVTALRKVYNRSDGVTLGRTLRIIRDAYGDSGFDSAIIDGVGHLCGRYNGELEEDQAIERLGSVRGGVNGLRGRAESIRLATGHAKAQCVAAAAVEIINRGRGGKKLPGWWKE
jgi:hypothetical protein